MARISPPVMDAGRVIAACFALSAFGVAVVAGLAAGNDAAQILLRAVAALVICSFAGQALGLICEGVIRAHIVNESGLRVHGGEPEDGHLPQPMPVAPRLEEARAAA